MCCEAVIDLKVGESEENVNIRMGKFVRFYGGLLLPC